MTFVAPPVKPLLDTAALLRDMRFPFRICQIDEMGEIARFFRRMRVPEEFEPIADSVERQLLLGTGQDSFNQLTEPKQAEYLMNMALTVAEDTDHKLSFVLQFPFFAVVHRHYETENAVSSRRVKRRREPLSPHAVFVLHIKLCYNPEIPLSGPVMDMRDALFPALQLRSARTEGCEERARLFAIPAMRIVYDFAMAKYGGQPPADYFTRVLYHSLFADVHRYYDTEGFMNSAAHY